MFCPRLKVPWLRECVRNNSVSFPKAFSGFSLFRASPEEYDPMTTYISAWVDVLATWHYFKNFPLLSFNKRQTPLKNHLLFHIFMWFIWRSWTEVEKGKGSSLWSLHSMEINHRNTPFSHSTTTHCSVLIKAFTGKGLFSLDIFFSFIRKLKNKTFSVTGGEQTSFGCSQGELRGVL